MAQTRKWRDADVARVGHLCARYLVRFEHRFTLASTDFFYPTHPDFASLLSRCVSFGIMCRLSAVVCVSRVGRGSYFLFQVQFFVILSFSCRPFFFLLLFSMIFGSVFLDLFFVSTVWRRPGCAVVPSRRGPDQEQPRVLLTGIKRLGSR